MVIEEKTLKTLKKKENKQMNTPNYSINKSIKSITKYKSIPQYELQKDSLLEIRLPNGMDLIIYSNEEGDNCSIDVNNHVRKGNFFKTTKEENTEHFEDFKVNTQRLVSTNYSYGMTENIKNDSRVVVQFKEFTNK